MTNTDIALRPTTAGLGEPLAHRARSAFFASLPPKLATKDRAEFDKLAALIAATRAEIPATARGAAKASDGSGIRRAALEGKPTPGTPAQDALAAQEADVEVRVAVLVEEIEKVSGRIVSAIVGAGDDLLADASARRAEHGARLRELAAQMSAEIAAADAIRGFEVTIAAIQTTGRLTTKSSRRPVTTLVDGVHASAVLASVAVLADDFEPEVVDPAEVARREFLASAIMPGLVSGGVR